MKKVYLFLYITFCSSVVWGQASLTNASPSLTIDFSNTMPIGVGSNPSTAYAGAGFDAATAVAGRLNSNAWAVTGWSDGALAFGGARITAVTDYTRGATGVAQTTGGMYAFTGAPHSAANPALMIQPGGSDWAPGTLTLRIQNNGTSNMTQLAVSYNIYNRNDQARGNSFNFSYSSDDATYTPVGALDYTSPAALDALGWVLVGSAPSRSTTITGLTIAPGAYVYIRWSGADVNGSGSRDEFGLDDISLTGTFSAGGTPDIALSSPNPAVTAGNITQGSTSATNNPIYRFDLAVTTVDATLNGVTVTTAGTYAASDITNFKCWYSSDATFSPGTDVLLSTKTTGLGAGAQVFPSFTNQSILTGATGYIFITADLPCSAVPANNISVNAITTADISFVSGNKSGSAFAGGLQTIIAATPNDVTVPAASVANASSSLSWTTPAGCYDDVLIVAATATNTGTPSGTTYAGSLVFGAGAPLGNGFVVYQGSGSPQVVTGLTNGTPYFYKFFTRLGTTWTAGVEVSATPVVTTLATDYFRSVAPGGNWGSTTTWESSPDNGVTPWTPSTLVPTASANTITIRNTANVTVAATAGGDQIVVDAGATLSLNANFTLAAHGSGIDLNVNGTVVNTSGTHTFTGTASFNAGSIYQHNRNGGTVPTATWDITSLFEVTGGTSAAPTNITQTLGNFTWNSNTTTTTNLVGTLTTVAGNFRVQNSGSTALRLTGTADLNLTVGGNFIIEDDLDIDNNVTGVSNISIGGNFIHTAGTFQSSVDLATITMTGVAKTFTQSGGVFASTNLNWIVNSGAGLTLLNNLPTSTARTVLVDGTLDAAALQITGAGDVTVNGTLRTSNTNGLELTGTLANSGTKTLGVGSIVDYYAAGPQILSNRADYANVIIDGGGTKILNGNAILSGNLTLTNGVVISTAANLITLTNTATTSGVSNASYVSGPIKKIGNTIFTFPIGKIGLGYVPIGISNFIGGTATDEFVAEYIRGNARLLGPVSIVGLDHVSGCEYWTLDRPIGTPTVDVTCYWSANSICNGGYVDNLAELVIAHFNGTSWDAFGTVGTASGSSTAGNVVWSGVSTFSPFALGSTTFGINPLPITINYFNGSKQNSNHLLNWKVSVSSSSSVSMEIQRSTDGRTYTAIYNTTATAIQCQQPFAYTDNQAAKGVNYYRLKMTDANGKISYSNIVPLINADNGFEVMSIAPNPIVNRNFNLNVSAAQKTNMELVITDMQGRLMQKKSVNMIAGFNAIPVNVSGFAPGTYQVYGVTAEGRSKVTRFVIQ